MNRIPPQTRRVLIRLSYWMPAITLLCTVGYALIPHLYFLFEGRAHETVSVFDLIVNTARECRTMLGGNVEGSPSAVYFAAIMYACVILSWISLILYAPYAVASAVCSTVAFAYPPTDPRANRAKRWMQFLCPNRTLFVLAQLLPLVICAFPTVLLAQYRNLLWYEMSLHTLGPSDLVIGGVTVAIGIALALLTLPMQSSEHMDLYRLYKAKKDKKAE